MRGASQPASSPIPLLASSRPAAAAACLLLTFLSRRAGGSQAAANVRQAENSPGQKTFLMTIHVRTDGIRAMQRIRRFSPSVGRSYSQLLMRTRFLEKNFRYVSQTSRLHWLYSNGSFLSCIRNASRLFPAHCYMHAKTGRPPDDVSICLAM